MQKIIGLDVGKSSVVVCCLDKAPHQLKRYFNRHKAEILTYPATRTGVAELLALDPNVAAMEPTGVHYSELWFEALDRSGVEVRFVGHVQVRNYRKGEGLPSKNDKADALALAAYCAAHLEEPEFFLKFTPYPVNEIRRLSLQLQHLNRLYNPIVNCTRQYLAHEFPEASEMRTKRENGSGGAAPLWSWLAGESTGWYYDKLWEKSVARQLGLEISDFTRMQAKRIVDIQQQQTAIEARLKYLLQRQEFTAYNQVFDLFGFGLKSRSLLLAHIYPFGDFLDKSGQPIVEVETNERDQKLKRPRSVRAFKLRLGFGLVEDASGKRSLWIPGGSHLCRKALWQWCRTRIEPKKVGVRVNTRIGRELGEYIDSLKAGGTPAELAEMRCCAKAVTLLFYQLLAVVGSLDDSTNF